MRTLISWLAPEYDFEGNKVSPRSPNYNIHFVGKVKYDKHIILYSGEDYERKAHLLRSELDKSFRTCKFSQRNLYVSDPFDFGLLMPKMRKVLEENRQDDLDVLFSNGTTIMRITWYVLATDLEFNIRLIQGKIIKNEPFTNEFSEIKFVKNFPGQVITQKNIDLSKTIPTPKIKHFELAKKIARFDNITVLISGESGTGKEGLAKYIHESSSRNDKKFLPVNCSALSDQLLESRLFGYVKGAFTGATENRKGIFEEADGGMVFLDEIGDISPFMQQSLLRLLQEKVIMPVGSNMEKMVDVRIIAATNKQLASLVRDGKFREDLYFRLAEAEIKLPPLREYDDASKNEIIDSLISEYQVANRPKIKLDTRVRDFLLSYSFPGNIRELHAIIKYFYVHNTECITKELLPERLKVHENRGLKTNSLDFVISQHCKTIYEQTEKNLTKTAQELGISVNTTKKYLFLEH